MPSDTGCPQLPVELVEAVFSIVWSSSLSREHRISLMTSSLLVNKAWMAMFLRMSLARVYIPNSSYLDTYLAALSGASPFLNNKTRSLPGLLCQSITVAIDYSPTGKLDDPTPLMEKVLSNLLYFLRIFDATPHLRILSIDYIHASFNDFFDFLSYNPLPASLTRLELRYAFPECTHNSEVMDLRHTRCLAPVTFNLPHIRHLTLLGSGSEALVASLAFMCPALETLQLDNHLRLGGEFIFAGVLGSPVEEKEAHGDDDATTAGPGYGAAYLTTAVRQQDAVNNH
ncbi:hypothetical protein C0991_000349 [Blastosporella zonata]|nr:hypothetical protein C0991_000349 [Blastosporella zonata]